MPTDAWGAMALSYLAEGKTSEERAAEARQREEDARETREMRRSSARSQYESAVQAYEEWKEKTGSTDSEREDYLSEWSGQLDRGYPCEGED